MYVLICIILLWKEWRRVMVPFGGGHGNSCLWLPCLEWLISSVLYSAPSFVKGNVFLLLYTFNLKSSFCFTRLLRMSYSQMAVWFAAYGNSKSSSTGTHRCDCRSVKTAVLALEIWSCHSMKLFDKAEACDHFLSVYFWDLRRNVWYSIFTHVLPNSSSCSYFYFCSDRNCRVHNCCLWKEKKGENKWGMQYYNSIHPYLYNISSHLELVWIVFNVEF